MSDEPEITVRKYSWPVLMSAEQLAEAQAMRDAVTNYFVTVTDPNYVPPPRWEGPPITPVPDLYGRLHDAVERRVAPMQVGLDLIELHGPQPWMVATDGTVSRWVCEGCELNGYDAEYPDWPCQTTAMIARHLGVEVPE